MANENKSCFFYYITGSYTCLHFLRLQKLIGKTKNFNKIFNFLSVTPKTNICYLALTLTVCKSKVFVFYSCRLV